MSDEIYSLVSQWVTLPDTDEWYGISIIACSTSDTNRIAIADGWSPHDHGSVLSPDRILAYEPLRQSVEDGHVVFEPQPPGWFERRCALLRCSWFPALVRRMAAGELVTMEELRQTYRTHNGGRDILIGTWDQLRQASVKGQRANQDA